MSGDTQVGLRASNLCGQKVRILDDQYQTAGEKQFIWDGTNLNSDNVASRIYFYPLEVYGTGEVRRMVLLR